MTSRAISRRARAPGPAEPSAPDEPRVPLRLIVTRGALGLELYEPVELGPLSVRRLSLTLPGLAFPLDLSGGVRVFRHRRGELETLELALAPESLARWLEPRWASVLGGAERRVTVWVEPPRIGLGLVSGDAALAFDLLWAPSGGDARLIIDAARGANLEGPALGYAMRAVDAALGAGAERRGRVITVEAAGARLGRALLPAVGARAPAASRVRFGPLELDGDLLRVELDSENPPAALSAEPTQALELARLVAGADEALARGAVDEARAGYLVALEQAPRHPDLALAVAEIDAYAEARDEAALALLVESRDPVGAGLIAASLLAATGDLDGAREAVSRAALSERFAPLAALGWRWLGLREPGAAGKLQALDRAVARAPALPCARWSRFEARVARGDVEGALADAEHLEAAATGPRARHAASAHAARALLEAGFGREAGRWFERALRYLPDDPAATTGFARSLIELGSKERAFGLLERAVALAERTGSVDAVALLELARLLARELGDLPQAIARARQVPASSPGALEARGLEARWRAALGDLVGASLAWARVRDHVELTPEPDPRAVEWLREAARFEREARGDALAAERHLAVALRAAPRDRALGDAYRRVAAEVAAASAAAGATDSAAERRDSTRAEPPPQLDESGLLERAEALEAALRLAPGDGQLARELVELLEALGDDARLYALASAQLEDADPSERAWLLPRARAVLERLEADASARGRHDEARLYREARARLAVSGGSG